MTNISSKLDDLAERIRHLRQLKEQFTTSTGSLSQDIEGELIKAEIRLEKMQAYVNSYKNLLGLSDTQLCISNANEWIRFESDRVYQQAGPLLREKFHNRTLTVEEYWGFVFETISPLKGLRIRCSHCGRRTSYDLARDDGSPRVCVFCGAQVGFKGIPRDYDEDINEVLEYLKDHEDQ